MAGLLPWLTSCAASSALHDNMHDEAMQSASRSAIVLGASPSGFAAALALAEAGIDVLMLEAQSDQSASHAQQANDKGEAVQLCRRIHVDKHTCSY